MKHILLLAMVVCLNSCVYFKSLVNGVQQPLVEIEAVHLGKASFQNIDLKIDLDVENPNDFDISLKDLKYKVYFKQLKLASGRRDEELLLKGDQSSKVRLGLKISPTVLLMGAGELFGEGKAVVKVKAQAVFETPLKDLTYEYVKEHEVR